MSYCYIRPTLRILPTQLLKSVHIDKGAQKGRGKIGHLAYMYITAMSNKIAGY